MINLFNYIDRPSPIHRLTGATKLTCMLLWCLAAMTSFHTPLLIFLSLAGLLLFREKPNRRTLAAMGVIIVSLALLNI